MKKEIYRVDMVNEMCCVVGTTICMEESDLMNYAEANGWELTEVETPEYVYDENGELRDDLVEW